MTTNSTTIAGETLFSDCVEREIRLTLLEEFYADIRVWCESVSLDEQEGMRTLLANGLAYMRGERILANAACDAESVAEALEERMRESADCYAMYSVMKYNAFKFREAASLLQMKLAGARGELESVRVANAALRARLAEVEAELANLRQKGS